MLKIFHNKPPLTCNILLSATPAVILNAFIARKHDDRHEDERNRAGVFAKQEQTTICSAQEFALWHQSVFTDHAATTKETFS